jgi:hypothetical protein
MNRIISHMQSICMQSGPSYSIVVDRPRQGDGTLQLIKQRNGVDIDGSSEAGAEVSLGSIPYYHLADPKRVASLYVQWPAPPLYILRQ